MMLLYKAWRESRTRFLLMAIGLSGFCVCAVLFRPQFERNLTPFRGGPYREYIYTLIYGGEAKAFFAFMAIFLGLGGLLRERAHHTEIFTLALPVSRARLTGAHVAFGLAELATLALLPALLLPSASALVHQAWPMAEALRYSLLWFSCGAVIFATSFVLAVSTRGEYTAPVACLLAMYLEARLAAWGPFRPYDLNILRTMGARWDWLAPSSQINELLPWVGLSIIMLAAAVLFAVATGITQRQNL